MLIYLLFLSILSVIFFGIYRQSDKKGFGREWIFFKMLGFIAASLARLITPSTKAMKPSVINKYSFV